MAFNSFYAYNFRYVIKFDHDLLWWVTYNSSMWSIYQAFTYLRRNIIHAPTAILTF